MFHYIFDTRLTGDNGVSRLGDTSHVFIRYLFALKSKCRSATVTYKISG